MTIGLQTDKEVRSEKSPLIQVKNCTMEFPGVRALDDVSFTLMPGECHGLVGENGAGKSTLSKCIIGENHMTRGELYVEGKKIKIPSYSIKESQRLGIQVVHQEFQLMSDMTGLENIFIGHYQSKSGLINWKALGRKAKELMEFLQCDVNLNVPSNICAPPKNRSFNSRRLSFPSRKS